MSLEIIVEEWLAMGPDERAQAAAEDPALVECIALRLRELQREAASLRTMGDALELAITGHFAPWQQRDLGLREAIRSWRAVSIVNRGSGAP